MYWGLHFDNPWWFKQVDPGSFASGFVHIFDGLTEFYLLKRLSGGPFN